MKAIPIYLRFGGCGSETLGSKAFLHDFSGIAALGNNLWLMSDEGNAPG